MDTAGPGAHCAGVVAEKINSLIHLFERIDEYLVRWTMRKYKRLRRARSRTRQILADIATRAPRLFVHWHLIGPPKA